MLTMPYQSVCDRQPQGECAAQPYQQQHDKRTDRDMMYCCADAQCHLTAEHASGELHDCAEQDSALAFT